MPSIGPLERGYALTLGVATAQRIVVEVGQRLQRLDGVGQQIATDASHAVADLFE
jgi:hypothetical protein